MNPFWPNVPVLYPLKNLQNRTYGSLRISEGRKLKHWLKIGTVGRLVHLKANKKLLSKRIKKNLFNNLLTPHTHTDTHRYTHTHACTHTDTERGRHTQTHRTDRHTQTHRHTEQTGTHRHTQTHTHYPDYRLYPNLYIIQTNATHFNLSGTSKFVVST